SSAGTTSATTGRATPTACAATKSPCRHRSWASWTCTTPSPPRAPTARRSRGPRRSRRSTSAAGTGRRRCSAPSARRWCCPESPARSGRLPPRGLLDVGREIRDLLHLAHFNDVAVQHRGALGPFDRFGSGLDLDHPVAAEHLLRLGEGAVGHPGLAAAEADAGALGGRLQP